VFTFYGIVRKYAEGGNQTGHRATSMQKPWSPQDRVAEIRGRVSRSEPGMGRRIITIGVDGGSRWSGAAKFDFT